MMLGKAHAVSRLINHPSSHVRHVSRFATVGVLNTALDFGIFSALFYLLAVPILWANSIAYIVAVANSYLLNRHWTFAERKGQYPATIQCLLFFALNGVGLALSNATVWLLSWMIPAMIAKACAVGVTFVWNFWTNRRLVYRTSSQHRHP